VPERSPYGSGAVAADQRVVSANRITVSSAIISSDHTGYAPIEPICEMKCRPTTTIAVTRAQVRMVNRPRPVRISTAPKMSSVHAHPVRSTTTSLSWMSTSTLSLISPTMPSMTLKVPRIRSIAAAKTTQPAQADE